MSNIIIINKCKSNLAYLIFFVIVTKYYLYTMDYAIQTTHKYRKQGSII